MRLCLIVACAIVALAQAGCITATTTAADFHPDTDERRIVAGMQLDEVEAIAGVKAVPVEGDPDAFVLAYYDGKLLPEWRKWIYYIPDLTVALQPVTTATEAVLQWRSQRIALAVFDGGRLAYYHTSREDTPLVGGPDPEAVGLPESWPHDEYLETVLNTWAPKGGGR